MKKKKKVANTLKIGILLLGFTLFLSSCEKENSIDTLEQKSKVEKIQGLFNKEQFKEVIPYKFEVNWNDNGVQYSEELKTSYYEFEISYTSKLTPDINITKKKKGGYYNSFKIIATINDNEIVDFYALRVFEKIVETGDPKSKVSLETISNFNGLIHLVNKENEIVFAKKFDKKTNTVKNYYNKEFKELDPLKSKLIESCVTVTTVHYKDWYKKWTDAEGEHIVFTNRQYLGTTEEEICGYEWLPDYGGGDSGSSEGSGVYKNECSNNTNSKTKYFSKINQDCATKITEEEVECIEGFELNEFGKCVKKDDQIVNELEEGGKANCVYEELQNNDLLKSTLQKFKGKTPNNVIWKQKSNLTIKDKYGNDILVNGYTQYGESYNISIFLNTEQTINRPSLAVARTILHEAIHADIYRKIKENGGLKFSNGIWLINSNPANFQSLFNAYNEDPKNPYHNYMAKYYREALESGLKEYATSIGEKYSDQFYKDMAWAGLLDTKAWEEQYADAAYAEKEKKRIQKVIQDYRNSGNNDCK